MYTTKEQIRRLTNLEIADISDDDMDALILDAIAQLNSDINTSVTRERVFMIDNTRTNEIDGSNTTFYVRNWKGKYLGDRNNDGEITIADMKVYLIAPDGTESTATISSVTSDEGKFILSSAPSSGVRVEINYAWCYENPDTPSAKISLACAFLVAAYSYEKINRGLSPEQVYGNVKFKRDMRAGNEYFQRYESQVAKVNDNMGDYSESEVF